LKGRNLIKPSTYCVLFLVILFGCREKKPELCTETDIPAPQLILVVGQSNTHYGLGLNEVLDAPVDGIYQLGRFENNSCIIPVCEPLDHHSKTAGRIGFALKFSKLLHDHMQGSQNLIIVPCGFGGTGFIDNRWNKTNDLYEDAVSRVNMLMTYFPDASIAAILWHQGETDVLLGNQNYEADLDNFINDLRSDLGNDTIPFILGGMVPFWVDQAVDRQTLQVIIKTSPSRHNRVGYADPDVPFVIEKSNNAFDEIHYDANGQRILAERYFEQYLQLTE
jgi:hypothetical protein